MSANGVAVHTTMDHDHRELEGVLERGLATLRRRWRLIVVSAVIAAAAAVGFSLLQRPKYTASASLLFQSSQANEQLFGTTTTPTSSGVVDPTREAATNQQLVSLPIVAAKTASALHLRSAVVSSEVSVSAAGQSDVARISVTDPSPRRAAEIANTYAHQYIAFRRRAKRANLASAQALVGYELAALPPAQRFGPVGQTLQNRRNELRITAALQTGDAELVQPASIPGAPSSPKPIRNGILGLILGLLLGLGLAFLLERLDRRIKTVEDLEKVFGVPLLAAVPYSRSYAGAPQADVNGHYGEREVFRMLRAYLRYFNIDREVRTVLVVSAAPGDGKTTVARNLAQAAQEIGTRALLIEADLRRPGLARCYGINPKPGLSELLVGSVQPGDAIRAIPIATRINGKQVDVTLHVMVAGHPPPNPAELIESRAMDGVLAAAAEHYELVVIDTPPLSVVSDAVPLLNKVDGVVVVGQVGKDTRDAAAFLKDRLVGVNAPLLGVIANGVDPKGKAGYGYGYGYGYYGAAQDQPTSELGEPTQAGA